MKPILILIVAAVFFVADLSAQTATPTPLSKIEQIEQERLLIQKETELLKARAEYLKAYSDAAGGSTVTRDTSGGKTTFTTEEKPILETVALSYEALDEIAGKVESRFRPFAEKYSRVVLFYEPDFLALSRYRLYREEARQALANYETLAQAVEDEAKRLKNSDKAFGIESVNPDRGGALVTALGLPSVAGSALKSVAELISLFRTDQTITQSVGVVDTKSLNSVIAGTLLKSGNGLAVYNPEQFVPEYDIGVADPTSFYETLGRVRAAEAYIDYFLEATTKIPQRQQDGEPLGRLIASAKIIKKHLRTLSFNIVPDPTPVPEKADFTEFRSMVRAEKLERFLKGGGAAAILKVRLLSSGGSRRESRNLILGTKTDYSGSAVIEMALYDTDGTMRLSEVIMHHTGFRKYRTDKMPKP